MNRRLVLTEIGAPCVIEEAPIPVAPPGGYVVKILYSGVCHSDVHLSQRVSKAHIKTPWVLGHEISGIIHEIGSEAAEARPDVEVGSKVVVYPWANCTRCEDCLGGRNPFCRGGPPLYTQGVYVDGGYQQYVIVHHHVDVFPVPDALDLALGAISSCSGITAWNAVSKIKDSLADNLRVRKRVTILIVGAGGLGYWAVEICKHIWPQDNVRVCVVDVLEEKLEDAKNAGADIVYKWEKNAPDEEAAQKVKEVCGSGIDAAIDFTGMTSSSRRIFHTLNTCASWVMVGLFGGGLPDISQVALTYSGIRIQGALVGDRRQMAEVLELISKNQIKGPPIEYIKLDEVNDVLVKVARGEQRGRAVVKHDN